MAFGAPKTLITKTRWLSIISVCGSHDQTAGSPLNLNPRHFQSKTVTDNLETFQFTGTMITKWPFRKTSTDTCCIFIWGTNPVFSSFES